MTLADLPALNACLNSLSAACVLAGYVCIRLGHRRAHRALMLCALAASAAFLTSYLYYHAHAGSTRFGGQGWIRAVYFSILISHTVLAAAIVPMVLSTVYQALSGRWETHRRLARWTWPVWLYVSATGVVVYWMLYRL